MGQPGHDLWNPLMYLNQYSQKTGFNPSSPGVPGANAAVRQSLETQMPAPTATPQKTPWYDQKGMFGLNRGTMLQMGLGMLAGRNFQQGLANSMGILGRGMQVQRDRDEEKKRSTALTKAMGITDPEERRRALEAHFPEQAAQMALQRLSAAPQERKMFKGADGYNYWADTQERVLPGIQVTPEREIRNDQNGVARYVDNGEPVYPHVRKAQAAPAEPNRRPVALGDGAALVYNEDTNKWERSEGSFGGVSNGDQTDTFPRWDEIDSPFNSLPLYDNGSAGFYQTAGGGGGPQFIPASGFQTLEERATAGPNREAGSEFDKYNDREWAKLMATWTSGGQAQAYTNLEKLGETIDELRAIEAGESRKNLTGPGVALQLSTPAGPFLNQNAVHHKDQVGSVVQQSLRAILGGQFAQKEGEDLLKRAYNIALDENLNADKLESLYNELVYRARINDYAAAYSREHGTMVGFDGSIPQLQNHVPRGQIDVNQIVKPDDIEQAVWDAMTDDEKRLFVP